MRIAFLVHRCVLPLAVGALVALCAGCTYLSSTTRRAGVTGVGAAAGAGAGYVIGDHRPGATIAGATAGGALTQLAMGEDPVVRQEGFDQGYVQGQSDAIKRQYFLRQALESEPLPRPNQSGQTVYYLLPGPEVTADGRKLAPHQVAVPVVE